MNVVESVAGGIGKVNECSDIQLNWVIAWGSWLKPIFVAIT